MTWRFHRLRLKMERRSRYSMSCRERVGKISPYPLRGGTHPLEQNRLPFPWLIRIRWPRIGYIGLVINIPADVASLEEGTSGKKMPHGSIELKNSFGDIGYGGPQPPKGTGDHPYVFTLYALSVEKLDLGTNVSLSAFKKALEGKVLGSATITGKYGR